MVDGAMRAAGYSGEVEDIPAPRRSCKRHKMKPVANDNADVSVLDEMIRDLGRLAADLYVAGKLDLRGAQANQ